MKRKLMVLLVGSFLLGLAGSAYAENQAKTYTVDPFTGFYSFDRTQDLDARSYYGLRAGYNFTNRVALEGMLGYVPTETRSMAFVDRDVRVWRFGVDVLYHFFPKDHFVPFIEAGIAATQLGTNKPEGMPMDGRGMINYGGGFKYFFNEKVALRGDVRQSYFTEGGASRINMEYTIGLTFALGTQRKAYAKPGDTTPPEVVCTSPDSAVTGVAISRNIVATFDEEMDYTTIDTSTFTLRRGTTLIPGAVTTSGSAATFNPSNDLEKGVIYTAKIAAGVKDPAGNALAKNHEWSFATIPAPKLVAAVLISLEDSHFDFDSAALSENGKTILNHNAKVLKENPKMKIRVAGYTSASGTKEYNQTLSEKRATVVKEYLIKEGGLDRERITKIGYGETRPMEYEPVPDDIYSEAAKANQRVLFEIITK